MNPQRVRAGLELILVPPGCMDEDDITGIEAVPGRLPATLRLPGETVASLIQRALQAASGRGALLAHFRLRDHRPQDATARVA